MGALRLFRIFAQRTQKVAATENDAYLTKPKQQRRMKKKNLKLKMKKQTKKSTEKRRKKTREEDEKNYGNGQDTHFCINMHRTHIFSFGRPDFQPGPQTYNTSA